MTGTIPAFDSYIAVDWSARNKPSPERPVKDAVWVGVADGKESYFRTRREAIDVPRDWLREAVAAVFTGNGLARVTIDIPILASPPSDLMPGVPSRIRIALIFKLVFAFDEVHSMIDESSCLADTGSPRKSDEESG